MQRLLTYFGLVGSAPPEPMWWAVLREIPPYLVAGIGAWLDGVSGWGGIGLAVGYFIGLGVVWLMLLMRFAPRRFGSDV